jgi:hypothetical protein
MATTQGLLATGGVRRPRWPGWVPVAVALTGIGWGSNQFTPVLLVYARTLGLSTGMLDALFGVYILGLIPGLLIAGPISDARGRRPVTLAAAAVSLAASVLIVAGAHTLVLLFIGRLAAGASSGIVFSAGTSWLREISLPPFGHADTATPARRAAVAMTIGFGAGPLVAGLIAQWAPVPAVLAYVPHLVVMILALPALALVPETLTAGNRRAVRFTVPEVRLPRFRRVVLPLAPWVFAAPAVAFAFLPEILRTAQAADGIALTAVITALTAFAGVAIQPLARRLDAGARRNRAAIIGLLVLTAGLGLAAGTARIGATWLLLPCALVFGAAYGLCLVAGLIEVQTLAGPGGLAGLTAAYYALTYLGFALPYLLAVAGRAAGYPLLLGITAMVALATAAALARSSTVPAPAASAPSSPAAASEKS